MLRDDTSSNQQRRREPYRAMWSTIQRARQRIRHADPAGGDARAEGDAATPAEPSGPGVDLSLALGRADLDRLITALAAAVGPGDGRPDTPARLEAALAAAIVHVRGRGRPSVTRRPAGLYTPEVWQVTVHDTDERTGSAISRAARGEGLA
jgi:hypothetical protein